MDYFLKIDSACQAFLVREMKNTMLTRKYTKLDIWFNSECLRRGLFPSYITLRSNNYSHAAIRAVHVGKTFWLRQEIRRHYSRLSVIELKLKQLFLKLTTLLHCSEFDVLYSRFLDFVEDKGRLKFHRLKNKLHNLIFFNTKKFFNNNSSTYNNHQLSHFTTHDNNNMAVGESSFSPGDEGHFSDFSFHDRILNLSDTTFTPRELETLRLGLKFNFDFSPRPIDLQILAIDCERALESAHLGEVTHVARSNLSAAMNKFYNNITNNSSGPTNTSLYIPQPLKSLRSKLFDLDLVVTKADKGNCTVILTRDIYLQKVNDFLFSDDFSLLTSNPTPTFSIKVNKTLKSCSNTISVFNSNYRYLIHMNPCTPRLYGLPKIHKPNIPIRPVVSFIDSPVSKLSSWLCNILPSLTSFENPRSIKNSKMLTDKIKDLVVPDTAILISFDVKNLFPSVPPTDCLSLVNERLLQNHTLDPTIVRDICSLVDLVLQQNFFKFNDLFYEQKAGLAMGSNLSPLMAEMFLSNLECQISKHPLYPKILFYFRYVDDILLLFDGPLTEIHSFLSFMNSLHPAILFTMEIEQNRSINFLDLTIQRTYSNSFTFSIFHKPTTTDSIIPYSSNHPPQHKFAFFHSAFHRLLSLPLSQDAFHCELNFIKQVAFNNGFPMHTINKIYHKHTNKFLNYNLIRPPDIKPSKFNSLPYLGTISHIVKNILNKYNINISFKTEHNLSRYIANSKDKVQLLDKSGVYKLSCATDGCDVCYIGQTGRRLSARVDEHVKEIKRFSNSDLTNCNIKSNFASHILWSKHNFDPACNVDLLHSCGKGGRLNLLEMLEINRALLDPNSTCVNDQLNFSCLPFLNSLVFSQTH